MIALGRYARARRRAAVARRAASRRRHARRPRTGPRRRARPPPSPGAPARTRRWKSRSAASARSSSTPIPAPCSARARPARAVLPRRHRLASLARSVEGPSRALGKSITGVANLGFLFLVVSGSISGCRALDAPRDAQRDVFRRGLRGKARDFNWHNVIGFWSCAPLVIVVASGVVISYPWATNLVYRVVGEAAARRAAAGAPAGAGGRPARARRARCARRRAEQQRRTGGASR